MPLNLIIDVDLLKPIRNFIFLPLESCLLIPKKYALFNHLLLLIVNFSEIISGLWPLTLRAHEGSTGPWRAGEVEHILSTSLSEKAIYVIKEAFQI